MIHSGNEEHGQMVMQAMDSMFSPVTMQVISRSEGGKFMGGIVYENYTGKGGSILVHISSTSKHWINRDMLFVMFDYPFKQLDCTQAFAQVKASNADCLAFCQSIGWKEVITLEGVFPDDDMVLLRLRRDDCRFLNLKPRTIRPNKGDHNG